MQQEIQKIKKLFLRDCKAQKPLKELEIQYLGRKGFIHDLTKTLASLPADKRVLAGKAINELKSFVLQKIEKAKKEPHELLKSPARVDVSLPGKRVVKGHLHPLTLIQDQMVEIFSSLNFSVLEGPEVETEFYNFDALNIPAHHPARDLWQTFWLKPATSNQQPATNGEALLLRTHTSPMQVRFMEKHQPPLRIIVPGRVFRYEASDATHDIQFYQLEGLMVDSQVSIANFKAVIETFFKRLFGKEFGGMRLRPSFFPFTEPSFEVDFYWTRKERWLEVMGAGMVHPNVFRAAGFAPGEAQGFAFGLGIDRVAMLKYGIPDIRLFYSGDLRFIRQF